MSNTGELPEGAVPPCPFCGNKRIGAKKYIHSDKGELWMIFCGNGTCSARVLSNTEKNALDRWTRRE